MHAASMLVSEAMRKVAKTDLQIRGLPVALRDKVRARADKKGQTMSEYLTELIARDVSQPSLEEWLEEVKRHPIPTHGDMSGAQAVREAREERAEQLAKAAEERWTRTQR